MESMKEYLKVDDTLLSHIKDLRARYLKLYETPELSAGDYY